MTETIFAWPGMGKLLIDSINVLDRPVVVAYLLVIVVLFVFIHLAVDLLYSALDPRIRVSRKPSALARSSPMGWKSLLMALSFAVSASIAAA